MDRGTRPIFENTYVTFRYQYAVVQKVRRLQKTKYIELLSDTRVRKNYIHDFFDVFIPEIHR